MENPSSKTRRKEKQKVEERKGVGLRNFSTKFPFLVPLFTCLAFDFLTSFGHFLVFFPFCPPVIAFDFGFFGILYEGLAIKAPRLDTVRHLLH